MKTYARRAAAVGALTTILAGGLLAGTGQADATTRAEYIERMCKLGNQAACKMIRA